MNDIIEAAIWLAILSAYAAHSAWLHRSQTSDDRARGRRPPPFQW